MTSSGGGRVPHRFLPVTGVFLAFLAAAGCAGGEGSPQGTEPGVEPNTPPAEATDPDRDVTRIAHVTGEFESGGEGPAILFDEESVPEGAQAEFEILDEGAGVYTYEVDVAGFAVNSFFTARVYTQPCGEDPDAAGPVYEDDEDTEPEPGGDEIPGTVVMPLASDDDGAGRANIQVEGEPFPDEMRSLLFETDPSGGAGTEEGEPVACLDIEFDD